jgi:hypothetical protein
MSEFNHRCSLAMSNAKTHFGPPRCPADGDLKSVYGDAWGEGDDPRLVSVEWTLPPASVSNVALHKGD